MGDASICCRAAASISPPAAAMTARICALPCGLRNNQSIFEEGMEVLKKLWGARAAASIITASHYQFEDVRITPQPIQKPLPVYMAHFPSLDRTRCPLRLWLIVAPFAPR